MTYLAITIFPVLAIVAGIASLFSLVRFVGEIYRDLHRTESE